MNYNVCSWNTACSVLARSDHNRLSIMCFSSKAFRLLKYLKSLYLDWWYSSLLNNTSKWTDMRCDGCLTSDWHVLPKMQLTASVQSLSRTPALSPVPICDVGTLQHTTHDGDSSYWKQLDLTLNSCGWSP